MRYLIDTNIWLERLLEQEKSADVERFLRRVDATDLCITDFSFHSICIIMMRLNQIDDLIRFVNDILDGGVFLIHLEPNEIITLIKACEQYQLDFDDGYQYLTARNQSLELVSFDSDFDRTDIKRKTPQ